MTNTKIPVRRIIFNNYNPEEDYKEAAIESLQEMGNTEPTENDIWDEIYFLQQQDWEEVRESLKDFFDGSTILVYGTLERWNGKRAGGSCFSNFATMFCSITKDCDYWNFYDENGHLFLECSHHDGTNLVEIKNLTEKGEKYLSNWKNSYYSNRSIKEVYETLMKSYSTLPRFAHKVYGLPNVEYQKITG